MKKMRIGQVNSESSVTIQSVKKQKKIDKLLAFKYSKRYGHETLIRTGSEGDKGATVYSNTASKSCEQNTVATFNNIGNVSHGVAEPKRDVFRTLANQVNKMMS